MNGAKILMVDYMSESFPRLAEALAGEGMEVVTASTGQQAMRLSYEFRPHLAVVAEPLPDMASFELCRMLRQFGNTCIILMVPDSSEDLILQGYEHGADDCVVLPVSVPVMVARVQAVLQRGLAGGSGRNQQLSLDQYADDHLAIDLARRRVMVEGRHVHLTPTEFRLLAQLMRCAGDVLTYEQILDLVWDMREHPHSNYVHTYISRLRHKLEKDPHSPQYLLSEPRIGYRFR